MSEGSQLLQRYLDEHELTQPALAKQLGVKDSQISRWLRAGHEGGRYPDLQSALLLADKLGIPVDAWRRPEETANDDDTTADTDPAPPTESGEGMKHSTLEAG